MNYEVPIWEKYALSLEEASVYFRIGLNKLRAMVNENPGADWVIWNNTQARIKRKKFEKYLDDVNSL